MSEHDSDVLLFHSTNFHTQTKNQRAKLTLKPLSNGHILVDWSDLPKHGNIRQYIIHYKSLNNNRSNTLRVSRKKQNATIKKVEAGHMYEVQVCTVDSSNRVIESSESSRTESVTLKQVPTLRITKSTPDFIILEWTKPISTNLSDIKQYKLHVNDECIATFPPTENKFVFNHGELGKRHTFELKMIRKDQKVASSFPVSVRWPCVTMPKHHAISNGSDQILICWTDATSINDGCIESYMVHVFDSTNQPLNSFGPYSPTCRRLWIKDVAKGWYYYVLEIKLADSEMSIFSEPSFIECGNDSRKPILTCDYTDKNNEGKLLQMTYQLLNMRDNMKSQSYNEKCERLLKDILSTLTNLADHIHLNLNVYSLSDETGPMNFHLIIDGKENPAPLPYCIKNFPLELPRREKPYELAVSVSPAPYGTKSKTVTVESAHHFSFFCAHFHQQPSAQSCSYVKTLPIEKQLKSPMHLGFIDKPKPMNKIQVYDLKKNIIVSLPRTDQVQRLTIILFYINHCTPSKQHRDSFDAYAGSRLEQYNFISINCDQSDIDELQNSIEHIDDIECYTDFSSDDFIYEQKEIEKPLHQILQIHGVPLYFVLDFSGNVVWKGRLCIENQESYDTAMDHILALANQLPCSSDDCHLCRYSSMDDSSVDSKLHHIAQTHQSIVQQRIENYANTHENNRKQNAETQIVSMKAKPTKINRTLYHSTDL